jgi:hypothetical protein
MLAMLTTVTTIAIALAFGGTLVAGGYSVIVLGDRATAGRRVATLTPLWVALGGVHLLWMSLARLQHLHGVSYGELHEQGVGILAGSAVVLVAPWLVVLVVLTLVHGPALRRFESVALVLAGALAVQSMEWWPGPEGAWVATAISVGIAVAACRWLWRSRPLVVSKPSPDQSS